MMKIAASGFAMFGYAAAAPMATNPAFSAWMTEHGKQYESATELNMRLAIFEANMQVRQNISSTPATRHGLIGAHSRNLTRAPCL